ncbi:unnamed protein product [Protopolystoma xenopodis]|uniref:Uncharacterized protein n=1 Tax=Protopolystoma xenopodis TaxID=117903 RepID=A0A448WTW4_9PLAT|nr:unnamed protein product [Protopolystoma xenopodis]
MSRKRDGGTLFAGRPRSVTKQAMRPHTIDELVHRDVPTQAIRPGRMTICRQPSSTGIRSFPADLWVLSDQPPALCFIRVWQTIVSIDLRILTTSCAGLLTLLQL